MKDTSKELQRDIDKANYELEKPFRDIMFGPNKEDFKNNNKWDVKKISNEVGLSLQTVRKFIKRIDTK